MDNLWPHRPRATPVVEGRWRATTPTNEILVEVCDTVVSGLDVPEQSYTATMELVKGGVLMQQHDGTQLYIPADYSPLKEAELQDLSLANFVTKVLLRMDSRHLSTALANHKV